MDSIIQVDVFQLFSKTILISSSILNQYVELSIYIFAYFQSVEDILTIGIQAQITDHISKNLSTIIQPKGAFIIQDSIDSDARFLFIVVSDFLESISHIFDEISDNLASSSDNFDCFSCFTSSIFLSISSSQIFASDN